MDMDPIEFIKSAAGQEYLLKQLAILNVSDPAEREDIRSELTIKLLEKGASGFRGDSSVKYWLTRALKNAITDHRRKQYGRNYGRDINIPDEVKAMGEVAQTAYHLIHRGGFKEIRQAFEQCRVIHPETPTWPAFELMVSRFPDTPDHLRHQDSLNELTLSKEAADPTHALHNKDAFREALSSLSPEERLGIILKADKDLDADTCKLLFGMSISWEACRKRMTRLIGKIKQRLADKGLWL